MKTKITHYVILASLTLCTLSIYAQKKVIDYWSFNCTTPLSGAGGTNLTPIQPDYSTLSGSVLVYNQVTTPLRDSIIDNGNGGSTINVRSGYSTCKDSNNLYVRTRNPSSEGQFLWYMPTKGYQNIIITYATERSNNGPQVQNFAYSIDSGKTFITTGLPMMNNTVTTTWDSISLNLTGISAVNNTNKFVFEITYSVNDSVGSGNDRYDNVTLEGDSIPNGINELQANNDNYTLYPNPATDLVTIQGTTEGAKEVTIFNVLGQQVSPMQKERNKDFSIKTATLTSGIYLISIKEELTGKVSVLKVVKN